MIAGYHVIPPPGATTVDAPCPLFVLLLQGCDWIEREGDFSPDMILDQDKAHLDTSFGPIEFAQPIQAALTQSSQSYYPCTLSGCLITVNSTSPGKSPYIPSLPYSAREVGMSAYLYIFQRTYL